MARVHQDQLSTSIKVLADKQTEYTDLSEALARCASIATHQTIDPDVFTTLCIALIDVVLPRLAQHDYLLPKFQDIFMFGVPSVSFFLLSSGLTSSKDSFCVESLATTLIHFVSDSSRISHVISKPHNTDLVNHLLHLPSRMSNILLSKNTNVELLDETAYFSILATAIFIQPTTSDTQRDRIISELLARLVVMRKSNIIVSTFLNRAFADSHSDLDVKVKLVVSFLQKAPPSSMHHLTRALIDDGQCKSESFLISVLSRLLLINRSARSAVFYEIPFRHPLLSQVRRATRRIVRSLYQDADLINEGLIASAEMWSAEEFALGAGVKLQRQVTRLLLYYLRAAAKLNPKDHDKRDDQVMMIIVEGVHARLNEEDIRIRRHAMVVGEAASRHARDENLLTFDRDGMKQARKEQNRIIGDDEPDDGGDSDFSEIGHGVGSGEKSPFDDDDSEGDDTNIVLNSIADNVNSDRMKSGNDKASAEMMADINKPNGSSITSGNSKGRRASSNVVYTWPEPATEDWENEDDWESPDEYQSSSDDEVMFGEHASSRSELKRNVATLRKKLPAPMSVGRLLELLREMNGSDSGAVTVQVEEAIAAMRVIGAHTSSKMEERTSAIRPAAPSICVELVRFEAERYPDEAVEELLNAREKALVSIIQVDVAACGTELVQTVICGGTADIGRRLYALSVLSKAVASSQALTHDKRSDDRTPTKSIVVTPQQRALQPYGSDGTIARVRKTEGLTLIFRALVDGVCAGAGADFVEPDGRDCRVWAQALVTLATLADAAGKGTHGRWMRGELMDVAMNRVARINGDPMVRRAIALVLGHVIDGMADDELSAAFVEKGDIVLLVRDKDERDVPRKSVEWLQNATEDDADVGVRRFAVVAIRKLSNRIGVL